MGFGDSRNVMVWGELRLVLERYEKSFDVGINETLLLNLLSFLVDQSA